MDAAAPPGWAAAEQAARVAYGRLVAWLAWQWRDLAAAEDALADAFVAALTHWPRDGVPDAPEAWLLTAARRVLLQAARHRRVTQAPEVLALFDAEPLAPDAAALPDRRLQLLCACAHPALPAAVHAPLMLQAVLGLDVKTIAPAFLLAPATLAQRLVRAKAAIRRDRIAFELPDADDLPARVGAVLDGIYGAYTIGSDPAAAAPEAADAALRDEALYLAQLVAAQLATDAEAWGLLALLLHVQARLPARFDADGGFVPLLQQDTSLWRRDLMHAAEDALWRAAALRRPGPFQTEAAIQSAHHQRAWTQQTPWRQIVVLYTLLTRQHGGLGARIGHAVALAESGAVDDGLAALRALPVDRVAAHQPYWVALAHLLQLAGDGSEAAAARRRAAGLTADVRVRRFLLRDAGG